MADAGIAGTTASNARLGVAFRPGRAFAPDGMPVPPLRMGVTAHGEEEPGHTSWCGVPAAISGVCLFAIRWIP